MSGPVHRNGTYQHTSGTRDCRYCGKTLSQYPSTNIPLQVVYRCPERPGKDQSMIGDYA